MYASIKEHTNTERFSWMPLLKFVNLSLRASSDRKQSLGAFVDVSCKRSVGIFIVHLEMLITSGTNYAGLYLIVDLTRLRPDTHVKHGKTCACLKSRVYLKAQLMWRRT